MKKISILVLLMLLLIPISLKADSLTVLLDENTYLRDNSTANYGLAVAAYWGDSYAIDSFKTLLNGPIADSLSNHSGDTIDSMRVYGVAYAGYFLAGDTLWTLPYELLVSWEEGVGGASEVYDTCGADWYHRNQTTEHTGCAGSDAEWNSEGANGSGTDVSASHIGLDTVIHTGDDISSDDTILIARVDASALTDGFDYGLLIRHVKKSNTNRPQLGIETNDGGGGVVPWAVIYYTPAVTEDVDTLNSWSVDSSVCDFLGEYDSISVSFTSGSATSPDSIYAAVSHVTFPDSSSLDLEIAYTENSTETHKLLIRGLETYTAYLSIWVYDEVDGWSERMEDSVVLTGGSPDVLFGDSLSAISDSVATDYTFRGIDIEADTSGYLENIKILLGADNTPEYTYTVKAALYTYMGRILLAETEAVEIGNGSQAWYTFPFNNIKPNVVSGYKYSVVFVTEYDESTDSALYAYRQSGSADDGFKYMYDGSYPLDSAFKETFGYDYRNQSFIEPSYANSNTILMFGSISSDSVGHWLSVTDTSYKDAKVLYHCYNAPDIDTLWLRWGYDSTMVSISDSTMLTSSVSDSAVYNLTGLVEDTLYYVSAEVSSGGERFQSEPVRLRTKEQFELAEIDLDYYYYWFESRHGSVINTDSIWVLYGTTTTIGDATSYLACTSDDSLTQPDSLFIPSVSQWPTTDSLEPETDYYYWVIYHDGDGYDTSSMQQFTTPEKFEWFDDWADTVEVTSLPLTVNQNNVLYVFQSDLTTTGVAIDNSGSYDSVGFISSDSTGFGHTLTYNTAGGDNVYGYWCQFGYPTQIWFKNLTIANGADSAAAHNMYNSDVFHFNSMGPTRMDSVKGVAEGINVNVIDAWSSGGNGGDNLYLYGCYFDNNQHSQTTRINVPGATLRIAQRYAHLTSDEYTIYMRNCTVDFRHEGLRIGATALPYFGKFNVVNCTFNGDVWSRRGLTESEFNNNLGDPFALDVFYSWDRCRWDSTLIQFGTEHFGCNGLIVQGCKGSARFPNSFGWNQINVAFGEDTDGVPEKSIGLYCRWPAGDPELSNMHISYHDNEFRGYGGKDENIDWLPQRIELIRLHHDSGFHNIEFIRNRCFAIDTLVDTASLDPSRCTAGMFARLSADRDDLMCQAHEAIDVYDIDISDNYFYSESGYPVSFGSVALGSCGTGGDITLNGDTVYTDNTDSTTFIFNSFGTYPYSSTGSMVTDITYLGYCTDTRNGLEFNTITENDNGKGKDLTYGRTCEVTVTSNSNPVQGVTVWIENGYGQTVCNRESNATGQVEDTLTYQRFHYDSPSCDPCWSDSTGYNPHIIWAVLDGDTLADTITIDPEFSGAVSLDFGEQSFDIRTKKHKTNQWFLKEYGCETIEGNNLMYSRFDTGSLMRFSYRNKRSIGSDLR